MSRPPRRSPDPPPLSPADQWAEQQMQREREKALMNRVIGLVVLAVLLIIAVWQHWITIPWPF